MVGGIKWAQSVQCTCTVGKKFHMIYPTYTPNISIVTILYIIYMLLAVHTAMIVYSIGKYKSVLVHVWYGIEGGVITALHHQITNLAHTRYTKGMPGWRRIRVVQTLCNYFQFK